MRFNKSYDRTLAEGTVQDNDMNRYLQRKWSPLLEKIEDPWSRRCMAMLYENQMNEIYRQTRGGILQESTLAQNIPDIVKFVFPLVRRVWNNIISQGLFSVQPMSSPIGGIFYWKYLYGTTKGTITAGDEMIKNFDRNYSSEYVEGEVVGAGPGTNFTGTAAWTPIKTYSMGQIGIEFLAVAASGGAAKRIYDADGTGTLAGDVGASSTINYTSGAYDVTFDVSVISVTVNYYYNMEAVSANVPEVNVNIELEPVKAQSNKLKMLWSQEAADDMRAVLGMDIEPELTNGVASEISLGIDRTNIMTAYGSRTDSEVFDAAVPPGRNQIDHFRNIMTPIEKQSGAINTDTHRGPGNFIVTGPSVQPILGALATHGDLVRVFDQVPNVSPGRGVTGRPAFPLPTAPAGYGVYPMGFLQSRWTVIIDPYFPSGEMMIGLKGPMFTDSGLVYAPYVPLEMTSAFLDPADFTVRKGLRTRTVTKLVNNEFFRRVTVQNLP